jgi:hypothetical protein
MDLSQRHRRKIHASIVTGKPTNPGELQNRGKFAALDADE